MQGFSFRGECLDLEAALSLAVFSEEQPEIGVKQCRLPGGIVAVDVQRLASGVQEKVLNTFEIVEVKR